MGWECVVCGDRHELLHDMRLWTIRSFCLDAVDDLLRQHPDDRALRQVRAFLETWDWIAPGVVAGVDLDRFTGGRPDRSAALARVLDRAAVWVRAFGPVVPMDYLDARVNTDGARYLEATSSRKFVRDIARLRGLLPPTNHPATRP